MSGRGGDRAPKNEVPWVMEDARGNKLGFYSVCAEPDTLSPWGPVHTLDPSEILVSAFVPKRSSHWRKNKARLCAHFGSRSETLPQT